MRELKCPECGNLLLDGLCPSVSRDEDCYYCVTCKREYTNEDLDTNSVAYFEKLAWQKRQNQRIDDAAWENFLKGE